MAFLIFIFILSLLIVVHEAGHFWTAKRLGVRVDQFALGFGPKLLSKTFNGTEYCLCAIPLGGYVKMAGDERSSSRGGGEEFLSKPIRSRSLIVLMGPVVNYFFAYLCFAVVFMVGFIDMDATQKRVPAKVGKVMAGSPAEKAGLNVGDRVLRVNDVSVANWSEMQEAVSGIGARDSHVTIARDGKEEVLAVTPDISRIRDFFGREHEVSRIGIQPEKIGTADDLVIRKYGFFESFVQGAQELWSVTARTYKALWEIVTGQRSAKEGVTGLVGIFFIIKFAAGVGFAFLLYIVGVISASLAIFNLLPLVPLDGGHLFLMGLEKIRGRALSAKSDELVAKAGFGIMIALAVFVFYIDFERIGLIDKVVHLFK